MFLLGFEKHVPYFRYSIISWDPNPKLQVVRQLVRQLYTKFGTLNQASFYLWQLRPVLQHCKIPKYYHQDCLKAFLLLSTLAVMSELSGKSAHFAQKIYF